MIYRVGQRLIYYESFTVEAESEEEAIRKVEHGEVESEAPPIYYDVDETYLID